jgi:hypothetical protein
MNRDLGEKLATLRIERDDEAPAPGAGRGLWIALAILLAVSAGTAYWLLSPRAIEVRTAVVTEAAPGAGGRRRCSTPRATSPPAARRPCRRRSPARSSRCSSRRGCGREGQVLARLDDSTPAGPRSRSPRPASQRPEAALRRPRRAGAKARSTAACRALVAEAVAPRPVDAAASEVDALARARPRARAGGGRRPRGGARRIALDDTVIRAPFAGVAISKNAQPGEMISPISAGGGFTRTGISHHGRHGSLEIEVDVNEAYISACTRAAGDRAVLDAYPDWRSRRGHHHHPGRRPPEGDGDGAHRLRRASTRASCRTWGSRSRSSPSRWRRAPRRAGGPAGAAGGDPRQRWRRVCLGGRRRRARRAARRQARGWRRRSDRGAGGADGGRAGGGRGAGRSRRRRTVTERPAGR